MRRSTRNDAFTLAEVMVASAVALLIAAAVAAALIASFGAFSRAAARPEVEFDLARIDAFETIRSDLSCAALLGGIPFSGAEDGFSCARLLHSRRTPDGAAVVRIEWAAAPDGGCVRTATRAGETVSETRWGPEFGPLRLSYARISPPPADGGDGSAAPSGDREPAWADVWAGPGIPGLVRVRWGATEAEIAPVCALPSPDAEVAP